MGQGAPLGGIRSPPPQTNREGFSTPQEQFQSKARTGNNPSLEGISTLGTRVLKFRCIPLESNFLQDQINHALLKG